MSGAQKWEIRAAVPVKAFLHGKPIEVGDEVSVRVPSLPYREGIYRGISDRGLVRVQLWSSRLGRYTRATTNYHPSFVDRIPSTLERLNAYRGVIS